MNNQDLARELQKIEDRSGRLTPEAVVDAAKRKSHPLHDQFQWNDSVAGHQWRLQQARQMINGVRVLIEHRDTTIKTVAYVRDPALDSEQQGYRRITRLQETNDDRDAVIAECARAESHLRRAYCVAIALGYADEINDLVKRVSNLATRVRSSVNAAA